MNLVLFEPAELDEPLPAADPRAQHVIKVLRRAPGDTFVAGMVDGPLGTATLRGIDPVTGALALAFAPTREPPPLPPITLIVGLPRPQTARDLLRDATTLGVLCIHFVTTERSDPNYASASLWTSGEWRRHVLAGAAQACDTRLPAITWHHRLPELCHQFGDKASSFPVARPQLLALDNYEATASLASALSTSCHQFGDKLSQAPVPQARDLVLAFGPERGWGPADRAALRAAGFTLCSLGERVLRLETAVVAALALAGIES